MNIHNLRITELDPGKGRERARFLNYPNRLYRNDRYWVASSMADTMHWHKSQSNAAGEGGDLAYFLAEGSLRRDSGAQLYGLPRVGEEVIVGTLGVVAAARTPGGPERVGRIFQLEFANDEDLVGTMVDTAREWCQRRGIHMLRGPYGAFGWGDGGILVDGWNQRPTAFAPYHMPYYDELIRRAGLEPKQDLLMYRVHLDMHADTGQDDSVRSGSRGGQSLGEWFAPTSCYQVLINRTWFEEGWAFDEVIRRLQSVLNPDFILWQERDGLISDFIIALPDLNQVLRYTRGKTFPLGWLKRLWYEPRMNRARVLFWGVSPATSISESGQTLMEALIARAYQRRYQILEIGPIDAGDTALQAMILGLGGQPSTRYRIYETEC